jgi:arsenate reductase-like glutaredoxin family protein
MLQITHHARTAAGPRHRTEVIEYLKTRPSAEKLRGILAIVWLSPMLRGGEALNPAVIERPTFVAGHQARIGRPPERVLETCD